jgi:alkaline phosphatase
MGMTRLARRRACAALAPLCALAIGAQDAPRDPNSAAAWRAQGSAAVAAARALEPIRKPARNAILFIGDGMGVSTVTAARILEGQLRGEPGEENRLAFERLPHVALLKTYDTNQQVPDSAGTATALLTGVKTRAGVIDLDATAPLGVPSKPEQRVRSLVEWAEQRGLATGVVTTARLTHATPAAAYAHTPHRDWESDADLPAAAAAAGERDIARQFVEQGGGFESPPQVSRSEAEPSEDQKERSEPKASEGGPLHERAAGDGIDVALGGGRAQFLPASARDPEYPDQRGARADGRDLAAAWQAARPGRAFVWNRAGLDALDPAGTRQVLGLFEPSHMQYEKQRARESEPSLAELTEVAIDRLARHRAGFVLLVEGGRIDHGHHASSAYFALHEAIALSAAVDAALKRVDLRETLVVVTADHSHTFTFAGYPTRGNPILGLVRGNDERGDPAREPMLDASGKPYTTLGYSNGPGYTGASDQQAEGPKRFPHEPTKVKGITAGRPDLSRIDTADARYLQESGVPLGSETHGGEDVPLYAGGPGAHLFHGVQEQSYVYHAIAAALGWAD